MSLADLASLGSFVSGLAVLASLIFLYFQVRQIGAQIAQAERNQQASIRSERASRTVDVMIAALAEPTAADAIFAGNAASADMTATQVRQYAVFSLIWFTNAEDAFSQNAMGLLDEAALLSSVTSLKAGFAAPGLRAAWQVWRPRFHGDFAAFMDKLVAETPLAAGDDVTAQWKAAFVAERAKAPGPAGRARPRAASSGRRRPSR